MESYKLKYLSSVEEKVARIHQRIGELDARIVNTDKFKNIVEKISNLDDDIEGYSYCLKKSELNLLCMYLPANVHKVNVSKIYEIVGIRLDFKMASILYYNWQNNYYNKDNVAIFEIIMMNENVLYEFKKKFVLNPLEIIHWINNEDVEMSLSRFCARGEKGTIQEYRKSLYEIGIKNNSKLYKRCEELFYFVCQSDEYIRIGDGELVDTITKMNPKMLRMMLINMLERLEAEELRAYIKTADFFMQVFGYYGEKRYHSFFDKIDDKLEKKYHEWMNYVELIQCIEDKKRIEFWLPYISYGDIKSVKNKQALVMRFHDFVVVEFKGKNPTFWYNNIYYDQVLKGLVNGSSSVEELIEWFNANSKYIKKRERKSEMKIVDRIWMNNMLGIHFKILG